MMAINTVVILEQWLKIIEPLLSIKAVFTVQWRFPCPASSFILARGEIYGGTDGSLFFYSLDNIKLAEQIVWIFLKVHLAFNCVNGD